jgi:hypothetical protein
MEPVSISALIMSVGSLAAYLMKKMLKKKGRCGSKTAAIINELHLKLNEDLRVVISQEVARQIELQMASDAFGVEEDVVVLPRTARARNEKEMMVEEAV